MSNGDYLTSGLLIISSMILWYVNLRNAPLGGQKSFTLNHHLSAVEKKYISARYPLALSPIECLNGLGSAMLQKLPTKRKEVIC